MERRIVEYKIIVHPKAVDTAVEVSSFLAKGWELYGEVTPYHVTEHSQVAFAQAIVRRESS
jgi:hypothetical protein